MSNTKYYAVKVGRNVGIFNSWDECKEQVNGFKGAKYKSFLSEEEALEFLNDKPLTYNGSLKAYVDGSYNKETNTSGYGVIFIENDKVIATFKDSFANHPYNKHRNVFGEVKGTERAIDEAIKLKYDSICIFYDYAGIEEWATGNWKTNTDLTQEYSQNIKDFSNNISIYFRKVKAHASVEEGGDVYNDLADKLAKESVGINS